jgi:lauroyl/myristoyl acyltransferase
MKMKIEEFSMPDTGEKKDVGTNRLYIIKRLKEVIRQNTEQWFWFHRGVNSRLKNGLHNKKA